MKTTLYAVVASAIVAVGALAQEQDNAFDPQIQAMEWRNIGPFNGGRGTSVVGHPTDRNVFYFGHSSGGLWKAEDAGTSWLPVGDGQFRYVSVGAIALHEKNPDIMYVGLGEPQLRQSVSWGDGKSQTQSVELKINPNETYTRRQTDEKGKAWMALYEQSEKTVQAILKGIEAKNRAAEAATADPVLKDAAAAVDKLVIATGMLKVRPARS